MLRELGELRHSKNCKSHKSCISNMCLVLLHGISLLAYWYFNDCNKILVEIIYTTNDVESINVFYW